MRRILFSLLALFAAAAVLPAAVFLEEAIAANPAQASVQVRETKLRSQPKYWAPSVGSLAYGDRVSVLDGQDGWQKVKSKGGKEGFVPMSSLTSRRVQLSGKASAGSDGDFASDEVVLAGKGFNAEVEKQFAGQKGLDFKAVNEMERLKVSGPEVATFLKNGKLKS